jgi:hypothetical protein
LVPLFSSVRKYGIASPYGPAALASAVFLIAWVFPPALYSSFVGEPYKTFLDPVTGLFFALCVAGFIAGLRVHRSFRPAAWSAPLRGVTSSSPLIYVIIPLLVAMAFSIGDVIRLGGHINFIALLAARQGQDIKTLGKGGMQLGEGIWLNGPIVLAAALWWFLYRVNQLRFGSGMRRLLMLTWLCALLVGVVETGATVDRTHLMPLIIGSGILILFNREKGGQLRFLEIAFLGILACAAVGGVFILFSFLRGVSGTQMLVRTLLGYSIAAYNRLAMLLHGGLHEFYGGKGTYLFTYLQDENSALTRLIPFNLPNHSQIYSSEFSALAISGLNASFNWLSVFGYIFVDIGWATPVYTFFTGILAGFFWVKFKRGDTLGLAVYPFIAFWIVFWSGWNLLFEGTFEHLILTGIALAVWDRMFLTRTQPTEEPLHAPVLDRIPSWTH